MERRFTAFLLPALLIGLIWFMFLRPGSGSGTQQQPGQPAPGEFGHFTQASQQARADDVWQHTFGVPGEVGFRVTFDNRGAGVREVRLLDHYVSVAAKKRAQPEQFDDLYPLVQMAEAGLPLLVLEERLGSVRRFPAVRIDGAPQAAGGADTPPDFTRWVPKVSDDGAEVRFVLDCKDGRTLEKTFRHQPGRRDLEVEITLRSDAAGADAGAVYPLELRGVTLWNPTHEHVFGNPALAIGGWSDRDTGEAHAKFERAAGVGVKSLISAQGPSEITWAGVTNRFFGGFLYPADAATQGSFTYMTVENLPTVAVPARDVREHSMPMGLYGMNLRVPAAGEATTLSFRLYLGPKSFDAFDDHADYLRFAPVMTADLEPMGCPCQIPGVTWMAEHLLRLLEFLHGLVGNWGVAIILLTILVKVAVFFLNFRSQKAMRAYGAKMAKVKPELDAIQARYKDDPKQLQQEMMQLYRKHKMFPPLGGCLPLFLTIPVFLGLFTALRVSYDLRHQPFVGWIDDLSHPDALLDLGIPFVQHFNLLPLLWMVLYSVMMFRQKLPADPQQRTMQNMMRWMFLLFGVLLYNYASGLLLYMCTSMGLAFFEQWLIKRILGPMPDVPGVSTMPSL